MNAEQKKILSKIVEARNLGTIWPRGPLGQDLEFEYGGVEVADNFSNRSHRSGNPEGTQEELDKAVDVWFGELLSAIASREYIMNYYIPAMLAEEPNMDIREIEDFIDENINYANQRGILLIPRYKVFQEIKKYIYDKNSREGGELEGLSWNRANHNEIIHRNLKKAVEDALPHVGEAYTSIILKKLLQKPHGEKVTSSAMEKAGVKFINENIIPPLQDSLKVEGIYISRKILYEELNKDIMRLLYNTSPIIHSAMELGDERSTLRAQLSTLAETKKGLMKDLKARLAEMNNLLRLIKGSRPYRRRSRSARSQQPTTGSVQRLQIDKKELQGNIEEIEQKIDRINEKILEHDEKI